MFNAKKATDMAIYLLKKTGGVDNNNYTKILKLMYLAERESYARCRLPMCGDDMYSLPYGPILSSVTNFIRGNANSEEWNAMISTQGYNLVLKDPQTKGYKKLSRIDKRILDEQWETHKDLKWQEICEWTHQNCPEWDTSVKEDATPYKRTAIGVPELLQVLGLQGEELKATLKFIEEDDDLAKTATHWQ